MKMVKTEKVETGRPAPSGTINAGEAYTVQEFGRRLGLKEWALRSLKRKGLRMIKVSGRCFVQGRDFLEFLDREAKQEGSLANAL
jgi:hypothetical protein